ncbi:hypothetical protein [Clostridium sp.]
MSKLFGTTIQGLLETVAIEKGRIASKEVIREVPNSETISAINEVQQMKKNPSLGKAYTDIDKMMEELLSY